MSFCFLFQKSKANNIDQQQQQPPTSSAVAVNQQQTADLKKSSSSSIATGALADILDLDFSAVQQQQNQQYILDHSHHPSGIEPGTVLSGTKAYSTREPLRPSTIPIESNYSDKQNILPNNSNILSSNSSTASSCGSRRPSATAAVVPTPTALAASNSAASTGVPAVSARKHQQGSLEAVSAVKSPPQPQAASAPAPAATFTAVPNSALEPSANSPAASTASNTASNVLRDTKIEIAGKELTLD